MKTVCVAAYSQRTVSQLGLIGVIFMSIIYAPFCVIDPRGLIS